MPLLSGKIGDRVFSKNSVQRTATKHTHEIHRYFWAIVLANTDTN